MTVNSLASVIVVALAAIAVIYAVIRLIMKALGKKK